MKKPLKVGFDLDGVLLYNPARNIRPFIKTFKGKVLGKTKTKFFIPKTRSQILLWELLHRSSLVIAPGFSTIEKLVSENKIEAYIITARFDHLEKDTDRWLKKLNQKNTFKESYINKQNLQPHIHKQQVINSLKLDIFVEDNWDIVSFLANNTKDTDIFWITNFFDKNINYKHKFGSLKKALSDIEQRVEI